jgi:8-oxo-dGTP pyrophosphatase MutT (NUDIX family)
MSLRVSAGVVVVRELKGSWRFLMLRAYRNWDFPKGLVESGEQPLQAAIREVREETLIESLDFRWGEVYRETAPYSHKKIARYYVAQTSIEAVTLPVRPELGRAEHNEWRWVTFEQGLALCSPRLDPIIRWAAETIGVTPSLGGT